MEKKKHCVTAIAARSLCALTGTNFDFAPLPRTTGQLGCAEAVGWCAPPHRPSGGQFQRWPADVLPDDHLLQ